jgi:hypothetical protein
MSNYDFKVLNIKSSIEFDVTERKFLRMLDLDLDQRNPNIKLNIQEKDMGMCYISFRNEFLNIEKRANDKQECLEKLRSLVDSLKYMSCDHHETGIFSDY